jgi:hypothetical protein
MAELAATLLYYHAVRAQFLCASGIGSLESCAPLQDCMQSRHGQ